MKITIDYENGTAPLEIKTSDDITNALNSSYPELSMMMAMEELNELGIAISKCIRNGNEEKLNNLAEEIVDVLTVIQWAIKQFNLKPNIINDWINYKSGRLAYRSTTDSVVFRSEEAKEKYNKNRIVNSKDSITVHRDGYGEYAVTGDIDNIPEYYHVLKTHMERTYEDEALVSDKINDAESWFDEYMENSDSSKKESKKVSKDLNKILDRASKNIKHVDKAKKRKKGK